MPGTTVSGTARPETATSGTVASGSARLGTSASGTAAPSATTFSATKPGATTSNATTSSATKSSATTSSAAASDIIASDVVAPRDGTLDATTPNLAPANIATPDTRDVAMPPRSAADAGQTGIVAALPMRHEAALPAGFMRHASARDPTSRDAATQDRNAIATGDAAAVPAVMPATVPPASPSPLPSLALTPSFASVPTSPASAEAPAGLIVRDLAAPVGVQAETDPSAPAPVDAAAVPAAPNARAASDPAIATGTALVAATQDGFSARSRPAADPFAAPDALQPQARHAPGDPAMSARRAAASSETMPRASPAEASATQAASSPTQAAQAPATPTQDPTQLAALSPAQLALPAAPSATPPAAAPAMPAEPASPPAAQIVPAMLAMHTANGAQSMMLRLTPAELGTVQIQISRDHDGAASVSVLVERPETLRLLLHDQAQLQHALTQAGLPQDRIVAFQQAPAGSFAAQEHRASTQDSGQGSGQDAGQNPGAGSDQGQAGRDGAARQQTGQGHDARPGAGRFSAGVQSYAPAWQPAGIDITA